jgi:hypothetical protein
MCPPLRLVIKSSCRESSLAIDGLISFHHNPSNSPAIDFRFEFQHPWLSSFRDFLHSFHTIFRKYVPLKYDFRPIFRVTLSGGIRCLWERKMLRELINNKFVTKLINSRNTALFSKATSALELMTFHGLYQKKHKIFWSHVTSLGHFSKNFVRTIKYRIFGSIIKI